MTHEWLPLHQGIVEIENFLTGSKHPIRKAFDWRVGRYYVGIYVPLRPDVADILYDWQKASIKVHTYTTLTDEGEEYESIYLDSEYIGRLYGFVAAFNERGHIDLAHQALAEADNTNAGYSSSPNSFYQYYKDIRPVSQIDKPVFFVIDFDHTVARTVDVFRYFMQAIYNFLPSEIRKHVPYNKFSSTFQEEYTLNQKKEGMFKPGIFVMELARRFGLDLVSESLLGLPKLYSQYYRGKMYEGAGLVLNRWTYLGRGVILTQGDQELQSSSVRASGLPYVVDNASVVSKKSPDAILSALQEIGYTGEGYVIGVGDRPSDAAAIKSFRKDSVSIRIRHRGAKYASEESKSPLEVPDYEFRNLLDLDFNLDRVFRKMISK